MATVGLARQRRGDGAGWGWRWQRGLEASGGCVGSLAWRLWSVTSSAITEILLQRGPY